MDAAMIAVSLALLLAPAPPLHTSDIGPEPTMEEFVPLAEAALSRKLRKDQQVSFEWPYRLVAGPAGYYTCGRVDPGKWKGGEEIWVSAVVARGQVVNSQWSTSNTMLAWECKRQIRKGVIAPR